ncbi:hypothetical protein FK220_004385 [Flavobacteriaceae bacterium TP-CH-4]|uniref:Uncharacterized protein n=1 Tax=Pelagihabitans pacificus TaxID=2696054 RepID=A0A967E4N0_9FLAO|nr:hypothetical protein [Pelagihabitans pacificus]NHF58562.1 hypothetical protein [Pelagihabitans pacificus]
MRTVLNYPIISAAIVMLVVVSCTHENTEPVFDSTSNRTNIESRSFKTDFNQPAETDFHLVLTSIQALVDLEYPIGKEAFEKYLTEVDEMNLSAIFEHSFSKKDFPLRDVKEAFEIHYTHNPLFKFARPMLPELPLLPPYLPDFSERPSACEVYYRDFRDSNAAACACDTYLGSLDSGFNNWQALLHGIWAGRQYVDTGDCP